VEGEFIVHGAQKHAEKFVETSIYNFCENFKKTMEFCDFFIQIEHYFIPNRQGNDI
jgi:hypothetical protein